VREVGKALITVVERFEYVAWIVDSRLPPSDIDAEWPVMFVVDAPFAQAAQDWGDSLARTRFPPGATQTFAWSLVVPVTASITPGLASMAVVACGHMASDAEIGW
jgi:hypothetical protein